VLAVLQRLSYNINPQRGFGTIEKTVGNFEEAPRCEVTESVSSSGNTLKKEKFKIVSVILSDSDLWRL